MPAEVPVTFTPACARAILAGRKTQARRIVRDPGEASPFGAAGDRLWLREGWRRDADGRLRYEADGGPGPWLPAGELPSEAARILLDVLAVRREALQAISEDDLLAEGEVWRESAALSGQSPRSGFAAWWNALHARPGTRWEDDPMVWVVRFQRIDDPEP